VGGALALSVNVGDERGIAERGERFGLEIVGFLLAEDSGQLESAGSQARDRVVSSRDALERAARALIDNRLAPDRHRRLPCPPPSCR
jgi:hypothetical protein